jgi:hypothetical protein
VTTYTAQQKRESIEREIKYRRRVFPRLIENGKMTRALADQQIAIFEAIRDDYTKAEQSERLI